MSLRVLFVMASPEYLRYYDSTIGELAARGHDVAVAVNSRRETKPIGLQRLSALEGHVRVLGVTPAPSGRWYSIGRGLRGVTDFVRYLHPDYSAAAALRTRMKHKAVPPGFRMIDRVPSLSARATRRLIALLDACERAIPLNSGIVRFIRAERPDVILLTPLVDAASVQVEFVKAARALGIPSAACIASWDNLTNKGLLRSLPDTVIVWNEAQRREAEAYHYAAPEQVVVTGAPLFDRWFATSMTRPRAEFCSHVGLPDDRPFVLFTGSSNFISDSTLEVEFVRRWVAALRRADDPMLRDINVVVRPHPYNCDAWRLSEPWDPGVVVYPRLGYSPLAPNSRIDFYDSIFHAAAVVGINTSAMIEAAIVGRPVLSIQAPEFARTQEGTLHFHHLLPEHGGFVSLASSITEHVSQLADRLRAPDVTLEQTRRFVVSFIRPNGLDRPATPIMADAVESLARLATARPRTASSVATIAIRAMLLVIGAYGGVCRWWTGVDRAARVKQQVRHARAVRRTWSTWLGRRL
jgi:hypothetical protein